MDELILFSEDEDVEFMYRDEQKLEEWTLYNGEARLVSLELLPMLAGVYGDISIFGSGVVSADDGCGYNIENESDGPGGPSADVAGSSSSAGAGAGEKQEAQGSGGLRIFLSAIREWKIEFGADLLFIWVKTDMRWYRLGKPSKQYQPFYEPVLKIGKLAVDIITMLKAETRASRLSFSDVVQKIAVRVSDWAHNFIGVVALSDRENCDKLRGCSFQWGSKS